MKSKNVSYRRATKHFWGRTDFLESGHFYKHFMCDIQMKGSTGKTFVLLLQDTLKAAFQMRI